MTTKLYESLNGKRFRLGTFANAKAAYDHVVSTYKVLCFEWDADHEGCADMILTDGRILCIETGR